MRAHGEKEGKKYPENVKRSSRAPAKSFRAKPFPHPRDHNTRRKNLGRCSCRPMRKVPQKRLGKNGNDVGPGKGMPGAG